MATVGSAIPKPGSCPRQREGDLPSEGWAAGSALPIRCSLSRIGRGESSRPSPGIIPARAVEVTHSMAALRDSLNTSAACTLPAVSLHRRYTWDAYHVGLAGQRAAGTQGAAGFSPRGPSDGATAGIHNAGGIGGLLAVEAPQAVGDPLRHWYFYDGNGNVGQLLAYDAAGPTVNATPGAKYEYDPYGQLVNWTDTLANPFRFSTKWHDTEVSLVYYGRRFYRPDLGRWLNRDPIEEKGGVNLYAFVRNRPTNSYDATGLAGPWHPLCCISEYLACKAHRCRSKCAPLCETALDNCWKKKIPDPCHAAGYCGASWLLCHVTSGDCGKWKVPKGTLFRILCHLGNPLVP